MPHQLSRRFGTGQSLSEAVLLAEHGENMFGTKIVLNVKNNFCTQHVSPGLSLKFSCIELVIRCTICRHIVGLLMQK